MGNEQDSIKEMLLEFKITSDEIVENTISSTELYELHVGDEDVMGPFWRQTIQSQIEVGSPLFTPNIMIRNLGTQEWVDLFQHPTFQRRKPSLVPDQEDLPPLELEEEVEEEEEDSGPPIMVLARGHKIGPLSLNLLRKKVGLKEILVTDLISHDQGQTWSKIFEMPEFDRREIGNREGLPHLPSNKVFNGSKLEVIEDLSSEDPENDTVINLVHLGKKQKEESAPIHSTPIQEKSSEDEVFNEKTVSLVLIIISLIGIGWFVKAEFFPSKKQLAKKSRKARRKTKAITARKASPPPPPEREQRPPAIMGPPVPPRGSSASTISRDRRPNMPDRGKKKMNDKALIDDRNYYDEPKEDERYSDDPRDQNKGSKKTAKKTSSARSQANGNDASQGAMSGSDDLEAPPEEGMDEGRDIAEENPDDFNSGAALDGQNEDNFDQQDDNFGGDEGDSPPTDDFGGQGGGDDQEVY